MAKELQPTQIRGTIVAISVRWLRDTYGEALFQKVLARLPPAERAQFSGSILPIGWYPLRTWVAFMEACRAEVKEATGEDEATFDRRNLYEAGGRFMQGLYKFVLSMFETTSVLQRLPLIMERTIS